jgi:hypothetical protein
VLNRVLRQQPLGEVAPLQKLLPRLLRSGRDRYLPAGRVGPVGEAAGAGAFVTCGAGAQPLNAAALSAQTAANRKSREL